MIQRVRLESINMRAILPVASFAVSILMIFAVILYARQAAEESVARDNVASQRQDQSLCYVLNENRAATRANTLALYRLVVAVMQGGGPMNPQTAKTFIKAERDLAERLEALKPINCDTYVRPELPLPTRSGQ